MVTDFFAITIDDWHDPAGALHAYLVPNAEERARLAPARSAAREVPFLAVQPEAGLHATIVRLPPLVSELDSDDLPGINARATESGRQLGSLTIEFGGPQVTADSLLVSARGDERWDALVELVRGAVRPASSGNVDRYPSPRAPHITIAYATGDGEDALIRRALAATPGAEAELGAITFEHIAWCAVHQNREVGTYTFEVLFTTPLGDPASDPRRT